MVDIQTNNYRMILVQNHEATTFILIIKENVITGNEIHIHSFGDYAEGYIHKTTNQSMKFVDKWN